MQNTAIHFHNYHVYLFRSKTFSFKKTAVKVMQKNEKQNISEKFFKG
jgi:hypothetical protein